MADRKAVRPTIVTACDSRYAASAANLIASIQQNSPDLQNFVVYDLGMKWWQRIALGSIENTTVRSIPAFTRYYLQCWSWKPWVWKNAPGDAVLYLDAGLEVLRSLSPAIKNIQQVGYYIVSQSDKESPHLLKDIVPPSFYDKYNVSESRFGSSEVIAAGIVGFTKKSDFFNKIIEPVYRGVLNEDNIGWSESEISRNAGMHYIQNSPVRACEVFRHDQTLLNLQVYATYKKPIIQEMTSNAGYKTRQDHPDQLMWHHRLQSRLPYLKNANLRKNHSVIYSLFIRKSLKAAQAGV